MSRVTENGDLLKQRKEYQNKQQRIHKPHG